ncbi:YacL family protein [Ferrimonas gelatinilytica]|uniref:YacL family protein n=1 Tax=Ferrimonas gelatinilytica TaxID=1255257 RepID=A0ABP9RSY4_9GAMM
MEYEFRREWGGPPMVVMSMGHEAIGRFVQEELSTPEAVAALMQALKALPLRSGSEYRQEGREQSLVAEADEVLIQDHRLHQEDDAAESLELNLYDAEAEACCGLEDFLMLLESWHAFLLGH